MQNKAFEISKRSAGKAGAELIESGMRVGLGSGSTSWHFIECLGERVKQGLSIIGIPTSEASKNHAIDMGIKVAELDSSGVDIAIDGADEIDPKKNLIKGRGGALVREKLIACSSMRYVVIADESKVKPLLSGLVPIEVITFGIEFTKFRLMKLFDTDFILRMSEKDRPFVSDNGNYILDGYFKEINDAEKIDYLLKSIPSVVTSGFFVNMTNSVIIGKEDGSTYIL